MEHAELCDACLYGTSFPTNPPRKPTRDLHQIAARKKVLPKATSSNTVLQHHAPRFPPAPHPIPGTQTFSEMFEMNQKEDISPYFPWAEHIRQALDVVVGSCIICTHTAGIFIPYHDVMSCPTLLRPRTPPTDEPDHLSHYMNKWRRPLHYGRQGMAICYICHLPNGTNHSLHPQFEQGVRCKYKDILSPVAYVVGVSPTLFAEAKVKFGQTWQDLTAFRRWVVEPSKDYPYNIHAVFIWYFRKGFPDE